MDITAIREFNAQKASIVVAMYPATIGFTRAPGTSYACAFGVVEDTTQLHESGQAFQPERIGSLHWPVTADVVVKVGQTFEITACAHDATLVGTKWTILSRDTASHESLEHYVCRRQV